ncbi:HGGxSTG domain-containing protein [Immundisolibacter cernigliae]|uniref:HGGxSTG domain-containing protein n=1 Tax=Immundisolibacter cernigliae TaxID=1810504 RepID=UPI0011AB2D17|nr:HGGxSTG domain-containing protein [Immundisolibacter cernigliae]
MSEDYRRRQDVYHDALLRWAQGGFKGPRAVEPRPPDCPRLPDELRSLTCGAKTRAGTPCKRIDLYESGRCRFHGGLSTGPLTPEGKQRAALNGLRPKKKRTP